MRYGYEKRIRIFWLKLRWVSFLAAAGPFFARAAIISVKVPAPSLADSNRTIIALPTSFDSINHPRYPVILMLHGWSGDETQWVRDAPLQYYADAYDELLVLPDGGYDGWWADSQTRPHRNYETHIVNELLPWLEKHYHATKSGNQRGITGLSMGGFGAVTLTLRHPDLFCAAASLSGIMDIVAHGSQWGLQSAFGNPDSTLEYWKAHNPLDLIENHRGKDLPPLFLICGAEGFAFQENQIVARRLAEKGADFLFLFPPGTHSHPFWKETIGEGLKYLNYYLDTPAGKEPTRWK